MALRGLVGGRLEPLVYDRPSRRRGGAAEGSRAAEGRELEVVAVARETPDAVTLRLRPVSGPPIAHAAGEFLTLQVTVGGRVLRRAYSICSAPGDARGPAVTVKRVAGGHVSNYLNDHAAPGMRLRAQGPAGSFVMRPEPDGARHLVLIAGGSGITPLMSILRDVLAREPGSRVTLLYGSRAPEHVIFRAPIAALAADYAQRLAVTLFVERGAGADPDGGDLVVGRLDGEALGAALDRLGVADGPATSYWICGPAPMMEGALVKLGERGVDPARVHTERFGGPAQRVVAATSPQPASFRIGGADHAVTVAPGQTLLEAGVAAGVPLKYSCTMGGCGACRVRILAGQVVHAGPNCLTAEEAAAGQALACVARPTSPVTVEA